MALTTIATNLIPDPRLTSPFDVSENASQSIGSDGRGVYATLTDITRDGWVAPFNGVATPEGGAVGVLLIESIDMLTPFTGSSLTSDTTLVWLRGSVNSYAHAIAVRSTDLGSVRLHLPQNGKQLHVTNVGLFDVNSWAEMQSRGILYFDGGGITEAQADGYTLPPATDSSLGGVIVGDGLSITTDGVLSVLEEDIPVATVDRVGGIRPGLGLRTGADGVTDVKIASNSHIQFNGDGELETYGLDVDFSDYYTKTQTDSMFYTRELADATFQKKDSSGGDQGGGDAGLSAYYQFMQLQHDETDPSYGSITNSQSAPDTVPFGSKTVTIGPGTFITASDNGFRVTRAGYYRLSGRVHYNVEYQAAEAGLVITPRISSMNVQVVNRFGVSYHGSSDRNGEWPKANYYDAVGILPATILDLGEGAQITVTVYLNGTAPHQGKFDSGSYLNLEWVGERAAA